MGLQSTPQWIVVRLVPNAKGKMDKLPWSYLTREACDAHDPQHWTTYDAASQLASAWGGTAAGWTIGFVLTERDDYFCVDIDGAATPGGWSPLALQIVQALPGCMVEVSQSGQGLHVWGRYPSPPAHAKKRTDLPQVIECYTEKRFIAWGTNQTGDIAERCDAFPGFLAAWFPPKNTGAEIPAEGPRADWRGPADDAELIRRAMRSQTVASKFGASTSASFADLWSRDVNALARAYPGDGENGVDWSSADMALAQHLAFWTGCDQARMLGLMQASAMKREKWEREDYLPRTIGSACGMQRDVLQDKPVAAPTPPAPPAAAPAGPGVAPTAVAQAAMAARDTATFLAPEQQAVLFAGCVYIADLHRVMIPGGRLYKPDQFRAMFGGMTFVMDARNERTVRNAFEAFTESQVLRCPIADGTAFRPDIPYGAIVESEGRRRANMYWPAGVVMRAGNVQRFLRHMEILFPNPQDRAYLLYWMAHCVQHPGRKSQWMPLLVGAEGNGKSLFSRVLAYAVGHRYTHWPEASKLGAQFNSWLYGKLLICIEDLKITEQAEVWERLKPMITGESLEIEGKGIDQRTDEVCANFIANSNHRDAIRATMNDRRICHLWCAQQSADEVKRDGLDEAYMSSIYDWLKVGGGYAEVAHFLANLPIPEAYGLNWFMGRAPKTSHHADAVAASLGPVEQEILEAIGREETGLRGGWASSAAIDRVLSSSRVRWVAPNRRREVMQNLGYDWHPALQDGRVNNPVMPDNAKVKLFVRRDSPALALTRAAEVAAAYAQAQGVAAPAPLNS